MRHSYLTEQFSYPYGGVICLQLIFVLGTGYVVYMLVQHGMLVTLGTTSFNSPSPVIEADIGKSDLTAQIVSIILRIYALCIAYIT